MSYEKIIHINERGQLVIPKKAREISGLGKSKTLRLIVDEESKLILEPIQSFSASLEGSAKALLQEKDVLQYIRELREDRE